MQRSLLLDIKLGSKPANHLAAMASFDDDDDLLDGLPGPVNRLLDAVEEQFKSIPE